MCFLFFTAYCQPSEVYLYTCYTLWKLFSWLAFLILIHEHLVKVYFRNPLVRVHLLLIFYFLTLHYPPELQDSDILAPENNYFWWLFNIQDDNQQDLLGTNFLLNTLMSPEEEKVIWLHPCSEGIYNLVGTKH